MTGSVNYLRAHLTLFVQGEGGQGNVEFTIDTGFNGALTLPPAACVALKLPLLRTHSAFLADGTQVELEVYRLTVVLDDIARTSEVLAIESEPLLGMTFLEGYEICLQVIENGAVRVAII